MEAEPHVGTWAIRMTPAERRKIRRKIIAGGKIADKIRLMAKKDHEVHEVPEAEQKMAQELRSVAPLEKHLGHVNFSANGEAALHGSFWQKARYFLKKLLIP